VDHHSKGDTDKMYTTKLLFCLAALCAVMAEIPLEEVRQMSDKLEDDDDTKKDILAMFNIVQEVLDETVVDFEAEVAKHMKDDDFVKGYVSVAVAYMKQAYNRVITPDQARTAMLEGFMDKLDIELKIFAKGLRDSMVKDKKLQMLVNWLRQHKIKKNDKREIEDYINVNTVRAAILGELAESAKGLWPAVAKRLLADLAKMDKMDKEDKKDLLDVVAKKTGLDEQEFRKLFHKHTVQGVINSAFLFGKLFAENFAQNDKANKVIGHIVHACLNTPEVVAWVEPRGQLLEILGDAADDAAEQFVEDVKEHHKTDKDTNKFLNWLADELKKEGKTVKVEDMRKKMSSDLEKLLKFSLNSFKGQFSKEFMRPNNRPVGYLMYLVQLGKASTAPLHKKIDDIIDTIMNNDKDSEERNGLFELLGKSELVSKFEHYLFKEKLGELFKGMEKIYLYQAMNDDMAKFAFNKVVLAMSKDPKNKGKDQDQLVKELKAFCMKALKEKFEAGQSHFETRFKQAMFKDRAFWKFAITVAKGVRAMRVPQPEPAQPTRAKGLIKPQAA
jgi:hypothetical protein